MKIVPVHFSNRLKFLITGGAGFIGSAVIRYIINNTNHSVVNDVTDNCGANETRSAGD